MRKNIKIIVEVRKLNVLNIFIYGAIYIQVMSYLPSLPFKYHLNFGQD